MKQNHVGKLLLYLGSVFICLWMCALTVLADEQPGSFSIISPSNNQEIKDDFCVEWTESQGAVYYTISIKNLRTNEYVTQLEEVYDTEYDVDFSDLQVGENYTIGLVSYSAGGVTRYGGNVDFSVAASQPGKFKIVNPIDNSQQEEDVNIEWTESEGALYYTISVLDETAGNYLTKLEKVYDTEYYLDKDQLIPTHKYKIGIVAYNEYEISRNGGVMYFTVPKRTEEPAVFNDVASAITIEVGENIALCGSVQTQSNITKITAQIQKYSATSVSYSPYTQNFDLSNFVLPTSSLTEGNYILRIYVKTEISGDDYYSKDIQITVADDNIGDFNITSPAEGSNQDSALGVTVKWSEAKGADYYSYALSNKTKGIVVLEASVAVSTRSFTISANELEPGCNYTFYVTAYKNSGAAVRKQVSFSVEDKIGTFQILKPASDANIDSSQNLIVSWSKSEMADYYKYSLVNKTYGTVVYTSDSFSSNKTQAEISKNNLEAGCKYTLYVTAYRNSGAAMRQEISFTTKVKEVIIGQFKINAASLKNKINSEENLSISWTAAENAEAYSCTLVNKTNGMSIYEEAKLSKTEVLIGHAFLEPNTSYEIIVTASREGAMPVTQKVSFMTAALIIKTEVIEIGDFSITNPKYNQVVDWEKSLTVRWGKAKNAEGYRVILKNMDIAVSVFEAENSGNITKMIIPIDTLQAGTNYLLEVTAYAKNADDVVKQISFKTEYDNSKVYAEEDREDIDDDYFVEDDKLNNNEYMEEDTEEDEYYDVDETEKIEQFDQPQDDLFQGDSSENTLDASESTDEEVTEYSDASGVKITNIKNGEIVDDTKSLTIKWKPTKKNINYFKIALSDGRKWIIESTEIGAVKNYKIDKSKLAANTDYKFYVSAYLDNGGILRGKVEFSTKDVQIGDFAFNKETEAIDKKNYTVKWSKAGNAESYSIKLENLSEGKANDSIDVGNSTKYKISKDDLECEKQYRITVTATREGAASKSISTEFYVNDDNVFEIISPIDQETATITDELKIEWETLEEDYEYKYTLKKGINKIYERSTKSTNATIDADKMQENVKYTIIVEAEKGNFFEKLFTRKKAQIEISVCKNFMVVYEGRNKIVSSIDGTKDLLVEWKECAGASYYKIALKSSTGNVFVIPSLKVEGEYEYVIPSADLFAGNDYQVFVSAYDETDTKILGDDIRFRVRSNGITENARKYDIQSHYVLTKQKDEIFEVVPREVYLKKLAQNIETFIVTMGGKLTDQQKACLRDIYLVKLRDEERYKQEDFVYNFEFRYEGVGTYDDRALSYLSGPGYLNANELTGYQNKKQYTVKAVDYYLQYANEGLVGRYSLTGVFGAMTVCIKNAELQGVFFRTSTLPDSFERYVGSNRNSNDFDTCIVKSGIYTLKRVWHDGYKALGVFDLNKVDKISSYYDSNIYHYNKGEDTYYSYGIHIHHTYGSINRRWSAGCLTVYKGDWLAYLSIYGYTEEGDWSEKDYLGKIEIEHCINLEFPDRNKQGEYVIEEHQCNHVYN